MIIGKKRSWCTEADKTRNMKSVALFVLCLHLTNAAIHSWKAFYTGSTGLSEFPQFIALNLIDDQLMGYFDSKTNRFKSQFKWMADNLGETYEDQETNTLQGHVASFQNNVKIVMERFNQTQGIHTNQRMYGCEWDDETGATNGFFQDGYDGEDFLSLDLKEMRWVSPVQQGFMTTQKWNNNRAQLEFYKQYFTTECIDWLKKYLDYGKSELRKKVSPQVSLLQKDSSSTLVCHATGFYPSGVKISWMRNGQEHEEDVDLGELLPNEDGTFQRTSTLTVKPDDLKQFSCVVEHQGKTEIITNNTALNIIAIVVGCLVALAVAAAIIGLIVWKKRSSGYGKTSTHDTDSENSDQPLPKA